MPLIGGVVYQFSFRAWTTVSADTIANLQAKVGDASPPYTDYTTFNPTLTATPTAFSRTFLPPANVTAGVAFIASAYYKGSVCVDDVVVRVAE